MFPVTRKYDREAVQDQWTGAQFLQVTRENDCGPEKADTFGDDFRPVTRTNDREAVQTGGLGTSFSR